MMLNYYVNIIIFSCKLKVQLKAFPSRLCKNSSDKYSRLRIFLTYHTSEDWNLLLPSCFWGYEHSRKVWKWCTRHIFWRSSFHFQLHSQFILFRHYSVFQNIFHSSFFNWIMCAIPFLSKSILIRTYKNVIISRLVDIHIVVSE